MPAYNSRRTLFQIGWSCWVPLAAVVFFSTQGLSGQGDPENPPLELPAPVPLFSRQAPNRPLAVLPWGSLLQLGEWDPEWGLWSWPERPGQGLWWASLGRPPAALPWQPGGSHLMRARGKSGATYLLDLPPGYDPSQPPPVLFVFSHDGDASHLVELIRDSTRRLGWVLVGCNGPRDGRDELFFPVTREILLDVRRRVPVDWSRQYLGGFSGGAMASYRLSRVFWNEFAGILALGGWLGLYEDHPVYGGRDLYYPQRLRVAMLNGKADRSAREWQEKDRQILKRFGIRSKVFSYPGGHQYPPGKLLTQGLRWLEEQWKGDAQHLPKREEAQELAKSLERSLKGEDWQKAAQKSLELLLGHSFRPEAVLAEGVLRFVFQDPERRAAVRKLTPPSPFPVAAGPILFARGRAYADLDFATAYAHFEAALLLSPEHPEILARVAYHLVEEKDPLYADPARAEVLAREALARDPKNWFTWYVQGCVQARKGSRQAALESLERAIAMAPNWALPFCRSKLQEVKAGGP